MNYPDFDFCSIKPGDVFEHNGADFVYLGEEQGGHMCALADPLFVSQFDWSWPICTANWRKSRLRQLLNKEFFTCLQGADLLPITSDLTAGNGDTDFGTCEDMVGIVTCDLYRKYREFLPTCEYMGVLTCTPVTCDETNTDYDSPKVYHMDTAGNPKPHKVHTYAYIMPICIFADNSTREWISNDPRDWCFDEFED